MSLLYPLDSANDHWTNQIATSNTTGHRERDQIRLTFLIFVSRLAILRYKPRIFV